MSDVIHIGLLGFGTVGAGVVEGLQRNCKLISERTGIDYRIKWIADLDLTSDRGVEVDPSILTKDAAAVVDDPEVDMVVELIGGTSIAKELMLKAIANGKPVVTANKALLAEHGGEIFGAARAQGLPLGYEASVAGGIPIIAALRDGLVSNRIDSIYGILNGTCNYILTRMEQEGLAFDVVLKDAQEKGFAEAEPSLDIDGLDTAHKAVLLASIAYGFDVRMDQVSIDGIRGMDSADIHYAKELGYRIKLLAVIKSDGKVVEVRVHPALVPLSHTLAHVGGVFNAILVSGDVVGETLYYGKGAGRLPTASAVIADIVSIGRSLLAEGHKRVVMGKGTREGDVKPIDEMETGYYLRMSLKDQPGSLAQIAHILGSHGISINSVLQKDAGSSDYASIIILTHAAKERSFNEALHEVEALDIVGSKTVRMRIEEFEQKRKVE